MIPRRRIALRGHDALAWLCAPLLSTPRRREIVEEFEQAFARRIGTAHARATASGREALSLILDGLGLGPGDELIIPGYTLGELLPLLQEKGIVLVPADVDPETYNVTPQSVATRLTPRTRAILAVHVLGAPCDIRGIRDIAGDIPVIEDCAHATGATIEGQAVGSFGHAALFSLEPTKPVSAFGGGVMTTDDAELAAHFDTALAERPPRQWPAMRKAAMKCAEESLVRSPVYAPLARRLFTERHAGRFDAFYRRLNARGRREALAFSAFQAQVATPHLARLDTRNAELNDAWDAIAAELPSRFRPQHRHASGAPAFYNLTARYNGDIRRLRAAGLARGIDLGIGDEIMSDTAHLLGRNDCPGAAGVFASAVQIPLYAGLSAKRRARLLDILHALARELP